MATKKKKLLDFRIPPPRIKRIMQLDEDVGKMAAPVPALVGRAMELFAEQLLQKSADILQEHHQQGKTLQPNHIKAAVESEPKFAIVSAAVANVPNLDALSNKVTRKSSGNGLADAEDDIQSPDDALVVVDDDGESKNSSDTGRRKENGKRGRRKKKPNGEGKVDLAVADGKSKGNRRLSLKRRKLAEAKMLPADLSDEDPLPEDEDESDDSNNVLSGGENTGAVPSPSTSAFQPS